MGDGCLGRMKRKNKVALITMASLVAAPVGIASAITASTAPSSQSKYVTAVAQRGNITQTIATSGTIQPVTETALSFGAPGMVSAINVQPGQRVRAGEVLAQLHLAPAKARLHQAQDLLLLDQANLAADLAGTTPRALQSAQAAVAVAQDHLAAVRQDLSTTVASNNVALTIGTTAVNQAQVALAIDQSSLLVAQQRFAIAQVMAAPATASMSVPVPAEPVAIDYGIAASQSLISTDQGYISADQSALDIANSMNASCTSQACSSLAQQWIGQDNQAIKRANLSIASADTVVADLAAVSKSESQLSQINANNTSQLDAASQAVTAAQQRLSDAEGAVSVIQQPASALVIAADQRAISAAKHALAVAQEMLSHSQIVAPTSGTVGEVNIFLGEDMYLFASTAGDIVIERSGQFEADVLVSDSLINQIRLGQRVEVTPVGDTAPLGGTVEQITPMAPTTKGVPSFPVTVLLDRPRLSLYAGISANVAITIAHRSNVLLVPTSCVHTNGRHSYVKLLEGGRSVNKSVKLGLSSGVYTQISSGLQQGSTVILANLNKPLPSFANLFKARKALGQAGVPPGPKISPLARVKPKR